jgi:hypothetical protein
MHHARHLDSKEFKTDDKAVDIYASDLHYAMRGNTTMTGFERASSMRWRIQGLG